MAAPTLTLYTSPLPAAVSAQDGAAVTIVATGTNLASATALKLRKTAASDIVGTALSAAATTVQAAFDVSAVTDTDQWDLEVTTPDGAATLTGVFLIYQLSIRELIMRNIITTIQGITLANGYPIQVFEVRRAQVIGTEFKNYPAVVVASPEEVVKEVLINNTRYHKVMRVVCEAWFKERGALGPTANRLQAAMEKALMADTTRGGRAISSYLIGSKPFLSDLQEPLGGVEVSLEVAYRHLFYNPYSNTGISP